MLVDHELCIGCRFCMAACPYDARSFNWGEPENPPGATFAKYSPEFPVLHRKGTVDKCMFCAHQAMNGQLPACASACTMSAIWFGDLKADIATNGLETVQLSWLLSERNAYRLKEKLGTSPLGPVPAGPRRALEGRAAAMIANTDDRRKRLLERAEAPIRPGAWAVRGRLLVAGLALVVGGASSPGPGRSHTAWRSPG